MRLIGRRAAGPPLCLDLASARREDAPVAYETITYERHEQIAIITLNGPERLNAWTPQMASERRMRSARPIRTTV